MALWRQAQLMYQTMQIHVKIQCRRLTAKVEGPELNTTTISGNESYIIAVQRNDNQSARSREEETAIIAGQSSSKLNATSSYDRDSSEMKRVFDLFDENKDGLICSQDLHRFMKRLGCEKSEEEVQGMVKSVDQNRDECVDFQEFLSLYKSMYEGHQAAAAAAATAIATRSLDCVDDGALLEAFFLFDQDKDGFISAVELQGVLLNLRLPEGRSLRSCERMIQRVDSDGNGQVDFFEFKTMMSSNTFQP